MTRSRAQRRIFLAGMLGVVSVLVSGCSISDLPTWGWPMGVTPQAVRMREFWQVTTLAALVVGVIVWGLMFWAFIVYHKRKGGPQYPKQTKENLPLELVYTAVPVPHGLRAVLLHGHHRELRAGEAARSGRDRRCRRVQVELGLRLPGHPVPGGGEVHTVGTSEEIPILVLPVNQVIQYDLSSKDVIHSFWTIDFLFKRDVFPHPEQNQTDNKFQNTITQTGAFVGRCAELCGTYHGSMNFEVRAVPQDVYDTYLDFRQTAESGDRCPVHRGRGADGDR